MTASWRARMADTLIERVAEWADTQLFQVVIALNFAPRVGVAWDPAGDGRMSIRAGYGMNSEFVNGQFFINAANAPPWGSELRLTRPRQRGSDVVAVRKLSETPARFPRRAGEPKRAPL